MEKQVAVVTGANRGLGWGVAQELAFRGYHVVLVGKNKEAIDQCVYELNANAPRASGFVANMENIEDLKSLAQFCEKEWGKVDVLVNNAAVFIENQSQTKDISSALVMPIELIQQSFAINSFAPYLLMQLLIPMMVKNNYGRVVNVSSGMGAMADMSGGWPAYRTSKTALNAFTKIFAEETKEYNIKVNAVCPGWVRTDMGGENANRSIVEGVQGIIWAATLDERAATGGFFRDGSVIDW